MNKLRAAYRGMMVALLLIWHVTPAIVVTALFGRNMPFILKMRRLWARRSIRALGVEVQQNGTPPEGCHLFVGNHRSYMDPIITLAIVEALPVAKAEVSDWPLIGFGAKATGIMYVKRESSNSRAATIEAMREVLQEGHSVLIYPEGTTHIEPQARRFKTGGFKLAAREGIPVAPIAMEYEDQGCAWIGNDTFVPHFVRCFGKKKMVVKVSYGEPVLSDDTDFLVQQTHGWINDQLVGMRSELGLPVHTTV